MNGSLNIMEDPFNRGPMNSCGQFKELTHLINGECKIRSREREREREILKRLDNAPVLGSVI
jgi:hypothetical protein